MIFKVYKKIINELAVPVFLKPFFGQKIEGVSLFKKAKLVCQTKRNVRKIKSATSWQEHIMMIQKILEISASKEGCVVECGSFKGASTASLSSACDLAKRRLVVFDSFCGLPETKEEHYLPHLGKIAGYKKGDYGGSLEEVRANIKEYGNLEVCSFQRGYFQDSMPNFKENIVFLFLDVDLIESLKVCLKYLWPLLRRGSYVFSHEAQNLALASLFFDKEWWRANLDCSPPGLIGAGAGVSYDVNFTSPIAYTMKI